jgi:hypothetical protein
VPGQRAAIVATFRSNAPRSTSNNRVGRRGCPRRATLRACQHAHATGLAVALDDGQALVLDWTREEARVVEADDAPGTRW